MMNWIYTSVKVLKLPDSAFVIVNRKYVWKEKIEIIGKSKQSTDFSFSEAETAAELNIS